jgi:hypothetical protein
MKKRIRNWIKKIFELYDVDDLVIGGHCGCCGAWIGDEIFDKRWRWGLCSDCINGRMTERITFFSDNDKNLKKGKI